MRHTVIKTPTVTIETEPNRFTGGANTIVFATFRNPEQSSPISQFSIMASKDGPEQEELDIMAKSADGKGLPGELNHMRTGHYSEDGTGISARDGTLTGLVEELDEKQLLAAGCKANLLKLHTLLTSEGFMDLSEPEAQAKIREEFAEQKSRKVQ